MNMRTFLPCHATFGTLLLLSSSFATATTAGTDAVAAAYFPSLTSGEKEEYTRWLAARSSSFPRHAFLPSSADPADGAAVFWNVDGDTIRLAVAVRAEGWVGLGLSPTGGMPGADVALYEASRPEELVDAHAVEELPLVEDDCSWDWVLDGLRASDGWTIVEMNRSLDTGDTQDHPFRNDADPWAPPTRLVAAWGDDDAMPHHGEKEARGSVRLFGERPNDLSDDLAGESDVYFDLKPDEFTLPATETSRHDFCHELPLPEGQSMLTLVGAVPIATLPSEFVQQITLYVLEDCSEDSFRRGSMIYSWTPGDDGFALPKDVGFPMHGNTKHQALHARIQYSNPSLITGIKDSTGWRIHFAFAERTHRAGVLRVGDTALPSYVKGIDDRWAEYEIACPSYCSSSFLSQEGVTVISEFLQMHHSGIRVMNEVFRDDVVVHTAVADAYDIEQNYQGVFHVSQDPFRILPGDSLQTTCYYLDGAEGEQRECAAHVLYYPSKETPNGQQWTCPHNPRDGFDAECVAELDRRPISSFIRYFGLAPVGKHCPRYGSHLRHPNVPENTALSM